MTQRVFLRMEGMNMSTFVEDTQDLSTIRGGSLLLLRAVERVKEKFSLDPISTGASAGLFCCTLPESMSPDCLRKKVERYLNHEDKELQHATFVVDVIDDLTERKDPNAGFVIHRERLLALNRWQQMQAPTLAVPKKVTVSQPCAFDGVRPAAKTSPRGELISESAWVRNKYGREQKQSLYTKETCLTDLPKFVNDLDELSDDSSQGRLHHKIAVIYLDGNKFGEKQNRLCPTPELQKAFDTRLKDYRRGVLRELLIKIKDKPAWCYQGQLLRMETLLWGGDELIWVVPAWRGFWTLSFFFDHTRDPKWEFEGEALTHAAGLVFCHHNAPIHRVTALARKLAGLAKEHSREANRVAYQILESFDHAGLDLKAVRKRRCPKIVSLEELILDGDKMSQVFKHMNAIRGQLPRRRLYQVLDALYKPCAENPTAEDPKALQKTIDEILKGLKEETTKVLKELRTCFSTGENSEARLGAWVHLADLWDYLQGEDTCPKNEKK
jgi:hypothetical protein